MHPRINLLAILSQLSAFSLLSAQPLPGRPPMPQPPAPLSVARLDRVEEVRKALGLSPAYDYLRDLSKVKIAILDYGFAGVDGKRPYLPEDTVVVEHYDVDFIRRHDLGDPGYAKGFEPGNFHGRLMAQIVWGATGSRPEGPKFYLLNANGPTLFRRAVRYAIEAKVDIILFSAVFEGGGNYDGGGPYSGIVDQAVQAGIVWINAAGNFGGRVYNGPVQVGRDGFLQVGRTGSALEFRNRLDENNVTVMLTWNDYQATEDAGTTKDLDLLIEDPQGKVIGRGELRQIASPSESGSGKSLNPRERVVLPSLGASDQPYRIRIQAKGGTFTSTDRIRVLVQATRNAPVPDPTSKKMLPAVELLDASNTGEIYPPADHPRVVTVGDLTLESSIGPTADSRLKPDVVIPDATATFTNGDASAGSSNAAAYFAAIAVTLRAAVPQLNGDHLLRYANSLRTVAKPGEQSREAARRELVKGTPPGLRDVSMRALAAYGYDSIVDRVQEAVGENAPVRLWLNAEGRVVLGIPQRPVELPGLFPNHPFPKHPQLSDEYECYLSLQPGPRGSLRIMDSFRLRADSPHRKPNQPLPQMAPHLVEIRQIPSEPVPLEERTRDSLLQRRWQTPAPGALTGLVRQNR